MAHTLQTIIAALLPLYEPIHGLPCLTRLII